MTTHWNAVVRILKYLKKIYGKELLYSNCGRTRVASFLDADWAGSLVDRLSTIGFCVFFKRNFVLKKQEAECSVTI